MTPAAEPDCPFVEQAIGWALHALEPEEELTVAQHVPGCPACRAAVRDATAVAAGLAVTVDQVEPPATLRSSILRAAAETPQIQVEQHVERPPDRPAASDRAGWTSWLSRRRLLVAAVALVAVVGVGGLAVRTSQLEHARDERSRTIAELVDTLVPTDARRAVLAASDGTTVGAVVLRDGQRQVLTVGMPVNATDRTYVLWGLPQGGAAVALGTFDVTAPDPALRSVGSGAGADSFAAYAVSLEPGRTAPATPSSVVAEGQLV